MSLQDPIADMLTRIRNAQLVKKENVSMSATKVKLAIANVLKKEGYINDVIVDSAAKPIMTISLKYYNNIGVIENITRISKPSLRVYKNKDNLPSVLNGLGIAIVSTPKGVMTAKDAKVAGIGGEVICYVS